jgi:UDP-N-acetylmuramate dehydrogenase
VTVLGVASNVIVRDGGIRGVVIRLMRGFTGITVEGNEVVAGAGAPDLNVALTARDHALAGLEFLSGIPGTIGGALRMNAGCFGSEIKDVFVEATALDSRGNIHVLHRDDMGFVYRNSGAAPDLVFLEAVLEGKSGPPDEIRARMKTLVEQRESTQPVRSKTGGSTFKNPQGHKAWQLIDAAGCRGLRRGNAQVSEMHCNFLINTGEATAADIEGLGEEVRARVKAKFGVELEWEIKRIGVS